MRQIEHIRQPEKSRSCGQACLAMILGTTLEDACGVVGHKKGTKAKALGLALRALGWRCALRLTPFRKHGLTDEFRGLAKVRRGSGNWHWVVIWDGRVFDPARAGPERLSEYISAKGRLTSGISVENEKDWP